MSADNTLEKLKTHYKALLEKPETQVAPLTGIPAGQVRIDSAALATLVVGSELIVVVASYGAAILRELMALRGMTQGKIEDIVEESEKPKIYKVQ